MIPICKGILIIKYGDPEADELELLEGPALAKSVQDELPEDVEGGHGHRTGSGSQNRGTARWENPR